jgi:hypothetical protein
VIRRSAARGFPRLTGPVPSPAFQCTDPIPISRLISSPSRPPTLPDFPGVCVDRNPTATARRSWLHPRPWRLRRGHPRWCRLHFCSVRDILAIPANILAVATASSLIHVHSCGKRLHPRGVVLVHIPEAHRRGVSDILRGSATYPRRRSHPHGVAHLSPYIPAASAIKSLDFFR